MSENPIKPSANNGSFVNQAAVSNDSVSTTAVGVSTAQQDVAMGEVFEADSPLSESSSSVNDIVQGGKGNSHVSTGSVTGESGVSMSSGLSDEREQADLLIESLRVELGSLLQAFGVARARGDIGESDAYMTRITRTRQEMETLKSVLATREPAVKKIKTGTFDGLKLGRNDIPKFRLASIENHINGKLEVFETDRHYIATLENIVESASMNMNDIWLQVLRIGLDRHTAWVNTELKKCTS